MAILQVVITTFQEILFIIWLKSLKRVFMQSTSPTLLAKLRDPTDQASWQRFVDLYTPLLFYWGRRQGLQQGDAADLAQDVLTTLVRKLPDFAYLPEKGFRNWLRTVTLNRWRDLGRKRKETAMGGYDDDPSFEPPDPIADSSFDQKEYNEYVYRRALEIVRRDYEETTWQACWLAVTTERTAADIGQELGLSEGAVYASKFRILKRLREELADLIDE
jgi:RNA polymerase sigma-70 factor, ECF subfamily